MRTTSVAIATRNRLDDLRRTIARLERLEPPPAEILVCADGCTDGTLPFLESHPRITPLHNASPIGSIPSRDRLFRAAAGDLILSLDDDSYPVEPDFLARLSDLFDRNPNLAVATFPQRSDEFPDSLAAADFGPSGPVASYTSSGAAIRRDLYLALGGYNTRFAHAYEEPDFAVRCFAAGHAIRRETSLTVRHHFTGVGRNEIRTHHLHARNEVWSALARCPFPLNLAVAAFRTVKQAAYAARRGPAWLAREPAWWIACARGIPACIAEHRPVPARTYLAWMRALSSEPKPPVPK